MRAALAGTPVTPFHAPPADTFIPEDTIPDPFADEELLDQIEDYYEGQDPDATPLPGPPSTTGTTVPPPGSGRIAVVPDVTGRSAESGVEILRTSGFAVSRRIVSGSGNVRSGTIVSQSPPGGALASSGSTVTIDVVGSN